MGSVLDRVDSCVDLHSDKLLYSFLDVNGKAIASHSYQSFLERVNLIASHLKTRRGFHAGDRVLLAYAPGLEMICALFACARAQLIPVPTAPPTTYGFTSALYRMSHISSDCHPVAMLTSRDCSDLLCRNFAQHNSDAMPAHMRASIDFEWIVTEDLVDRAGPTPTGNINEIFFLQYTSGSTSSPRGVAVTHDNILHNCGLVVDHETPVAVSWLPQHHDMGLLGYYIYILLSGGTTYGFSPTSFIQRPSLWLETITKHSATGSSAPNFAFEYCLRPGRLPQATLDKLELGSLRFLMAAAEPIKPDTYRRFLQKFEQHGLKSESFFVAYGLAENTLAVTNYGRSTVSVNRKKLSEGVASTTRGVSEIDVATHLMSCGKPLGDNTVRIVQPDTCLALDDGMTGEVWVKGNSKCLGYWNSPELTRQTFHARIMGPANDACEYLRTGDIGFFYDGELYICGRRKDVIIVRGQNFYPQDIESVVEQASPLVRKGCVVAFEVEESNRVIVAVVAEVVSAKARPDARAIATAVRKYLDLQIDVIAFVPSKSVPKTSSGKIMRYMTKQMWLAGQLSTIGEFAREKENDDFANDMPDKRSPVAFLKTRYRLTGDEPYSLVDAGMDSLDLVIFMHEIKELLHARGANVVAEQVDLRLIQHVSITDLFRLLDHFEREPDVGIEQFRQLLKKKREIHLAEERAMMLKDRTLAFTPAGRTSVHLEAGPRTVLLTGGTGFLGPFLLKSLIEQTDAEIRVLIRAASVNEARKRLRGALDMTFGSTAPWVEEFDERVVPVRGDLEKPNLALSADGWETLANEVDAIYHNAAMVNYLFSYAAMRGANVVGTNEMLRLAFDGRPKQFNHVSTTFVFGWATKDVLYEADTNSSMELLDFGYSQSKWVAEQTVADAARHGLETRIFRPALITPSVAGCGNNFDITIRLLAFMVKHGVSVDAMNQVSFVPADVTANNIVAIANQRDTVGRTFHVTRDEYANMVDIIDIIGDCTGQRFRLFPIEDFVPEVIRRCTRDDLLFPLLDFLIGSVENISSMEFKRYDSSCYQSARNGSPWGVPDPSLDDTVGGILKFMMRSGII